MRLIRLASLLALLLVPLTVRAQPLTWAADPAHTSIGFSVRHMMVTTVRGAFTKYTLEVKADPKQPTAATVAVSIDVASVTTGNAKRDAHLRSPDFFDADKHATMTFVAKKITRAGKSGLKVLGDLTIKGTTRPVTLAVADLAGPVQDSGGKLRLGFHAKTTIDRRDFGLTWNRKVAAGLLVSNEVTISIDAALIAAPK